MPILTQNSKVLTAAGKVLIRESSPLDLPNLKLYLSATRMPQYADGIAVPNYLDYSGNNYHASQVTGSLQPLFKTSQFGANAGLRFDGVDDILSLTGGALDIFKNINQFTVQTIAKRSVISTNASIIQFTQGGSASSRFVIQFITTGIQVAVRMLDATVSAVSIVVPTNDLNAHLIQCVAISNVMYVYVDGVFSGSIALDSSTSSNTASSAAYVGSLPNAIGSVIINGITVSQSYSDPSTIQAQYRGYLQRGYL